jgi:2'-5' RNA ligase
MSSTPAEPRQRLFFALWPDAATREALDSASRQVLGKRIRRVPPANLHITLAFAGSVEADIARCLTEAADSIRVAPFELLIDRVGHWPGPRIAWIGPEQRPAALLQLVLALREAFTACGLQAETRAYQPHVTLARKIGRLPDGAALHDPLPWSISAFSLVESVTDPAGVRYYPRASWPLTG